MGEIETPHFYDFWLFGRVPEPQNHLFVSVVTPWHLKESKKTSQSFSEKCYLVKSQDVWESNVCFVEKAGTDNSDDSFRKIVKILDMIALSIKNHEMEILTYGTDIF